jgi:hypothetical protein
MTEVVDNVEESAMSALAMSDEEIMNLDFDDFEESTTEEEAQADSEEQETSEEEAAEPEQTQDSEDDDTEITEEEVTEESDEVIDNPEAEDDSEGTETDDATEDAVLNYEEEYKKILAPFKANGREMQVSNVEEAVQLMQMGANYNKKMAALKPNLKTLKLLENNGLLDEQKLSYLIDLDKKNPDAISKLLKDSGIDPLDLDTDKASDYKPNTYSIDDREVELDEVLTELSDSQTYSKTIDLVSNKWDGKSKQIVAENPHLLRVIDNHMASGVYETVSNAVERERMFGRLEGLSDLEAYRQVGEQLEKSGALNTNAPAKTTKVVTKTKAANTNPNLKSKKRAASSVKASKSKPANTEVNALGLSDEEFEKEFNEKFI